MDHVKSNVVDVSLSKTARCTLDRYIKRNLRIPIDMFYVSNQLQAISSAIEYLLERGTGSVEIPSDENNPTVIITATKNKDHRVIINYSTYNYRFPINEESRPYGGGDWQIGDRVYNTDMQDQQCVGWSCTEAGTPGKWGILGPIRSWHSEVEEVSFLPEPGPMQFRRVLMYEGRSYICKLVDGKYDWYWLDYAYGTSAERPTTDLRIGLPYYNTELDQPEWWTGQGWTGIFSQKMIDQIAGATFEELESEFYNVFELDPPEPTPGSSDAMSASDIYKAVNTKYEGQSSTDPEAMTAEEVQTAVDTPDTGGTSEDPTALSREQILQAIPADYT